MGVGIRKGLTIELPLPPSTNNAYVNTMGGRRLTGRAKRYKLDVQEQLFEAGWKRTYLDPPYALTLYFYLIPDRKRDISNMVKLLEDAVAEYMAYDDSRNDELHLYRRPAMTKQCVVARLEQVREG